MTKESKYKNWSYKAVLCLLSFFYQSTALAQSNLVKEFFQLRRPVKLWVITHPFIAVKAYNISNAAEQRAFSISKDFPIDNDLAGGQSDAFRHGYWMALLSQKITPAKAWRLGLAYEKGNYIEFKKGAAEHGAMPDKSSCLMDIFNNKNGIIIGSFWKKLPPEEIEKLVVEAILRGEFLIVKKSKEGYALDKSGIIINEQELLQWENPKVLVRSDFGRE
jgi:hypothetical protein